MRVFERSEMEHVLLTGNVQAFAISTWKERATFMIVCRTFRQNGFEFPAFDFAVHSESKGACCGCMHCNFQHRESQCSRPSQKTVELYAKTIADGFCWEMAARTGDMQTLNALPLCFLERSDPSAWNNYAIGLASQNGHIAMVNRLLQDSRVDPSADDNYAIAFASVDGHVAVVDRLLEDPRVDPSAAEIIQLSSANGHVAVIHRLLQDARVDPAVNDNYAFRIASQNGRVAVVDRLLQDWRVDPTAENNFALRIASEKGHIAVVDKLLKDGRVDPTALDNHAIRLAAANGHLHVVYRLLQDARVELAVYNKSIVANENVPLLDGPLLQDTAIHDADAAKHNVTGADPLDTCDYLPVVDLSMQDIPEDISSCDWNVDQGQSRSVINAAIKRKARVQQKKVDRKHTYKQTHLKTKRTKTNTSILLAKAQTNFPAKCVDLTISDGAELSAGIQIRKSWQFTNISKQPWPAGTYIKFVSGTYLGPSKRQFVIDQEVAPNQRYIWTIDIVTPRRRNDYVSKFCLIAPSHKSCFPFWLKFSVV
eukprot:GILJ01009119.1.p1 GENE.GILJ01009119.1~~GILJ01009119.1.p1  ORF type:complete len:538 (-),score=53.13 GILJ01009119.1:69-1682(-)